MKVSLYDQGTAEAPIVVSSYRLKEAGPAMIDAGEGRGIDVYNASDIHISNLKIVGSGAETNHASGIIVHTSRTEGASHIRIDHVEVSGFGKHGISIGAWKTKTGYKDVQITHCVTHDNRRTGIMSWGPWGAGPKNHEAALYFSMGFFTGMRTSELQRLQWEHFFTERNIIILPAAVTKNNRTRQVPIQPVLKAWLDFLAPTRSGKVFPSSTTTARCIDFARPLMPPKRGMCKEEPASDWWENCMRDSYASYRAMTTHSAGQVALEIGNSEMMVKRCYFDVTVDEK